MGQQARYHAIGGLAFYSFHVFFMYASVLFCSPSASVLFVYFAASFLFFYFILLAYASIAKNGSLLVAAPIHLPFSSCAFNGDMYPGRSAAVGRTSRQPSRCSSGPMPNRSFAHVWSASQLQRCIASCTTSTPARTRSACCTSAVL